MDRLCGDHAVNALVTDYDASACDDAAVNPSDTVNAGVSVFVNVGYHEADLVHVRGKKALV